MPSSPESPSTVLPGMAGIALYMLVLSGVLAFGVLGHHYPPLILLLSAFTAASSIGLLRLRRWGWALALAACFLLMLYQLYSLIHMHQPAAGFFAFLNLLFFLYLVRPEVLERLK